MRLFIDTPVLGRHPNIMHMHTAFTVYVGLRVWLIYMYAYTPYTPTYATCFHVQVGRQPDNVCIPNIVVLRN